MNNDIPSPSTRMLRLHDRMPEPRSRVAAVSGTDTRWRPLHLKHLIGPAWVVIHLCVMSWAAAPIRAFLRRLFASELFDLEGAAERSFYLAQIAHPRLRRGAARAPLLHYLLLGQHLELSPSPLFDARYYVQENPDIPRRCSPFLHYVRVGRSQGRRSNALPSERITAGEPIGVVLLLDHGRGGGSTELLDIHDARLHAMGYDTVRLRRAPGRVPNVVIETDNLTALDWFDPLADESRFVALLRHRGITRIVVNHLIDFTSAAFAWLPRVAAAADVPFDVLLHDYYYLCPRVNLVDANRRYCGIASVNDCRRCLQRSPRIVADPEVWRDEAARFLESAQRVIAPSADLAVRMRVHFPGVHIELQEPGVDHQWLQERSPRLACHEPLRLVVIGSLNVAKGYDVVAGLAERIARTQAPIELSVMGASEDDAKLRRLGVHVGGRYPCAEADRRLATYAPHAALLLAIWPEAWSFALSVALRNRLPVIAFDHGAIAQRLRHLGRGTRLPLSLVDDGDGLLGALLRWRERHLAIAAVGEIDA